MLRSEEDRVRRLVREEMEAAGWMPPPDAPRRLHNPFENTAEQHRMPDSFQAMVRDHAVREAELLDDRARAEIRNLVRAELYILLTDLVTASHEQNQWEHDQVKDTFHSELRQVLSGVARAYKKTEENEDGS